MKFDFKNCIKKVTTFKKLMILLLVITMVIAVSPTQASAATVKINRTSATVYVGLTSQLKISGTSKKVTWKSSSKTIATVNSSGKVTAKKAGTATITATVNKKNYKCKVTVKNPYINSKTRTIYVKQTYNLKLTGTSIKYKTSDSEPQEQIDLFNMKCKSTIYVERTREINPNAVCEKILEKYIEIKDNILRMI